MISNSNNGNYYHMDMNNSSQIDIPLLGTFLKNFSNSNKSTLKIKNEKMIKEYSYELKEKEDLIRNYEAISKDLILMGFAPQLVLHSFLVIKYTSREEAVEFLSKNSQDLWNHKFIEGEDSLCFICDQEVDKHRKLKFPITNYPQNSENKLIDQIILEKKKSLKENRTSISFSGVFKINLNSCEICFMEINTKEDKFSLNCEHAYCKECIIEYLKEEIKNARVLNIKCPTKDCTSIFTEEDIKELVSDEYMYKFRKFLQRIKIKEDETLIICPIVNCEGYAQKDLYEKKGQVINNINEEKEIVIDVTKNKQENEKKKYVCNKGHSFCSVCSQAWHGDSSCDEDKEIKDFATYTGYILKKCVKCKVWIEKNEGCNHMTCKICGFNWCWLCENECPPDHYFREGTPCYGKQFNNVDSENPNHRNVLHMFHPDSIFMKMFLFYVLAFYVVDSCLVSVRPRGFSTRLSMVFALFFMLLCFTVISLIFNLYILLTMLINLTNMVVIRNPFVNLLMIVTFIILFFLFYIIGGPVLTCLWFVIMNLYLVFRSFCP